MSDIQVTEIDRRTYRLHKVDLSRYAADPTCKRRERLPQQREREEDIDEDEVDCTIEKVNNQFVTKLDIDPVFFKFIIGKAGAVKTKIQQDTGATVNIPKPGVVDKISIRGATQKAVISARSRIQIIVDQSMDKIDFNYFLCMPLNDAALMEKVKALQTTLVTDAKYKSLPGMDPTILVKPQQLHFTICMLKLYGSEAMDNAKHVLDKISKPLYDLVGTTSTVVKIQGLQLMNGEPSVAHVLYAKPHPDSAEKVQRIADFVAGEFAKEGIIAQSDAKVKIHATVLNTRYRRVSGEGKQDRIAVDARPILADFGSVDLGQVRIASVDLSQRGKFDENGFYHRVTCIKLP